MSRTPVSMPSNSPVASSSDVREEMLCARVGVGVADLDTRRHIVLEGPRVVEYLKRLLARDVSGLDVGVALKTVWLSDSGGVRGAAAIARSGQEQFWLLSATRDDHWICATAAVFDVMVRDVSAKRSGFAVIGPYSAATLEAAGLHLASLEPLAFRAMGCTGRSVVLSRFGEHGGYEVWSGRDEADFLREHVAMAGAPFGLTTLGAAAMAGLDVEAGIPRPGRDYIPARESGADEPSPLAWGLAGLIDPEHPGFNGRAAYLKTGARESRRLAGVEIDAAVAAPHAPLLADGRCVGRTLTSVFSPALRRAIALAQLEGDASLPGTRLSLSVMPSPMDAQARTVGATVVDLPILPIPGDMGQ